MVVNLIKCIAGSKQQKEALSDKGTGIGTRKSSKTQTFHR